MRKNRVALALANALPFTLPFTASFAQGPAFSKVLATSCSLPVAAQIVAQAPGKTLVASVGIDNLTDQEYWNFHPYPKRTWVAETKANF